MSAPRSTRPATRRASDKTIEVTRFPSLTNPKGERDSYAEWIEFTTNFETNYGWSSPGSLDT